MILAEAIEQAEKYEGGIIKEKKCNDPSWLSLFYNNVFCIIINV